MQTALAKSSTTSQRVRLQFPAPPPHLPPSFFGSGHGMAWLRPAAAALELMTAV
jgi:hypothetical protein